MYQLFNLKNYKNCKKVSFLVQKYGSDLHSDLSKKNLFMVFSTETMLINKWRKRFIIIACWVFEIYSEKQLIIRFPNINTTLSIFLSIITENTSGERLFSTYFETIQELSAQLHPTLSSVASFAANAEIFVPMDDFDNLVQEYFCW